ncbi:MAG: hypothetical protein HS108_03950 [Planctomycetes bacterium]|jgi:hypothetical protein|nr:hypothetical protein [Planctomycetota bacterium]MCL4731084.1 hypothetical protein [Planctomycetota bacterium]
MRWLATFAALAAAVSILLAQDAPAPEAEKPAEPAAAEKTALASAAYFVLRNRCWNCHGEPGKKAWGETVPLDWILDYDRLIEAKLVVPGKVKESRLVYMTVLGKMPRAYDEHGKPGKTAELSEPEQAALTNWVRAGAPRWPEPKYTHEWVPVGAPEEMAASQAHLFTAHDGVLRFMKSDEGWSTAVLRGESWQPAPLGEAPPVTSTPAADGRTTWLTATDAKARQTFVVRWDGTKVEPVKERIDGVFEGLSLMPGRDGNLVELAALGRRVIVNDTDEIFQPGAVSHVLGPNGWKPGELPKFPATWVFRHVTRGKDGRLVLLAEKDRRNIAAVIEQTAQDWDIQRWEWTGNRITKLQFDPQAESLLAVVDGQAQIRRRAPDGFGPVAAFQPFAGLLDCAWDGARTRWTALATLGEDHTQTWALVPWRK